MNQVRKSFPAPYLTPGCPCTGSSYSGCSWHPAQVGPAPHTSSFNCPDLSRPLLPKQPPPSLPKVPSNQGRHGNFLGTFLGNTSGNIHSSGRAAGCFYPGPGWGKTGNQKDGLPSHSKEKHSLGLQAWQTSEGEKSDIKTARGSISKTEQKIGFPHPPAALRAPHTAKNKARGPGICDASFLRSPCRASLPLGFLRVSLPPLSPSLQRGFPQHKGDSTGSGT